MFEKGTLIMYGNTGVCRVDDVGVPSTTLKSEPGKQYYKLTPLFESGVIYVPVDTAIFMRPLMTKEAAHRLIAKMPEIEESILTSRDQRMMKEHYQSFLRSHTLEDLVRIIKTTYIKEQENLPAGKKLSKIEEQYKKYAQELLYGELSVVLEIPLADVEDYIGKEIDQNEAECAAG